MTVNGIKIFAEALKEYKNSYVLIGGSACDLLMTQQGIEFRATKDLDIVILSDSLEEGFASAFWGFIRKGGYEPWYSNDGAVHFYRFIKPKTAGYPHMIELFSKHPDFLPSDTQTTIAPLPFDEDISSLSAILLNEEYYAFIKEGLARVSEINVLDEAHLIPLKMKAHIDLNAKHSQGFHVNSADLKKHRKDVLRLLFLVPANTTLELTSSMKKDVLNFIETLMEPEFRIEQLNLGISKEDAFSRLKKLFGL